MGMALGYSHEPANCPPEAKGRSAPSAMAVGAEPAASFTAATGDSDKTEGLNVNYLKRFNVIVAFGVVAILAACDTADGSSNASNSPTPSAAATTVAAVPTSTPEPTPVTPRLTNQQQNAARSATQYLSFSAFSRQGLIDQLSSSAGDKYLAQDATVAVDSLNVDWNAQAAASAKNYLSLSSFSCAGLIEQLSSSAGEKFTLSQATFGAKQAGAC